MPLTHLQQREQRRQAQRAESNSPAEVSAPAEPESNAFETSFAPLPPQAKPSVVEVSATPQQPFTYAPAPPSVASRPTKYVRVLHQTSGHRAGDTVLAAIWTPEEIERLIGLGAVAYDRDATEETPADETMATARHLAQPVMSNQAVPRAPWVQATVADILGPATFRSHVPRAPTGYSIVPAEHGQTLVIADPTPKSVPPPEPMTLTKLDAGSEAILSDPELNKDKQ